MRKLLSTLYILQEDIYLKLDGLNIVATKNGQVVGRVPFCNIENIVCFNYMGCTPALMAKCGEEGVSLSFLAPNGKFLARVHGPIKGNIHLRREQFRKLEDEKVCLYLAQQSIRAKITNTKNFLMKSSREYKNLAPFLDNTINSLNESILNIEKTDNLDSLRGVEGDSAREYFNIFNNLILNKDFEFKLRTKRPPLDPVNAILSYLYTLLALDCESALETVGLDAYMGYFHVDRSGRPALALDLMEEFRCYLVDRCVLNLINLRKINITQFDFEPSGAVIMSEDARKIVINEWQTRKKEEILHPVLQEKVSVGLLPYIQARFLAKFLRGEMEEYFPFIAKL